MRTLPLKAGCPHPAGFRMRRYRGSCQFPVTSFLRSNLGYGCGVRILLATGNWELLMRRVGARGRHRAPPVFAP
jgi:hypothetical protein